jgi:cobalt transporter subunit CbtA
MIKRMVTSAISAGVAAGLLAALLHFAFVQKYILLGEDYESGAAVHFAGVSEGAADATDDDHEHDHSSGETAAAVDGGDDHEHQHAPPGDQSAWTRNAMTVGFMAALYSAYSLILVAGFATAEHFGARVTARDGILWGIAAFVAVQLAPAMGLSPELPGTAAAPLSDRQLWWAATVVCSAAALAMIGYGRSLMWVGFAVVLLAAPHVIGAPELDQFTGVAPPEVAASFAARSLGAGLAVWATLGWLAGWLWNRDDNVLG